LSIEKYKKVLNQRLVSRHTASYWISPVKWTSLGTMSCMAAPGGYIWIKRIM
jgi:hypothetical protein